MRPIIVIPARMAATRLPGKPLADIHGRPMIAHVLDRAREAGIGPLAVACLRRKSPKPPGPLAPAPCWWPMMCLPAQTACSAP